MLAAEQRLKDAGYGEKTLLYQPEDENGDDHQIKVKIFYALSNKIDFDTIMPGFIFFCIPGILPLHFTVKKSIELPTKFPNLFISQANRLTIELNLYLILVFYLNYDLTNLTG